MTRPQADDPAVALLPPGSLPHVLAVIWATVDIERVLDESGRPSVKLPDDPLLGAAVQLVQPASGDPIALVEPRTEGRIAATLARSGEGPAGRYVAATGGLPGVAERAAAAGIALSREADGPFGLSVLVLGGSNIGPHLVLVDAGTIER